MSQLGAKLRLDEPTTALTDLVLGVAALYWSTMLGEHAREADLWPAAAMALALLAVGVGALAGVIVHGFQSRLSARLHAFVWRVALVAACLANYLLVAAVQRSALPPDWPLAGTILADLNLVRTVFVVSWVLRFPEYRLVVADSIISLVAVIAFLFLVRPVDAVWSAPLSVGVGLAFAAGLVQRTGWRRQLPFNHNDAYHVLQTAALYFFYLAGQNLFDR